MLVDDPEILKNIFKNTDLVIAVHCEDEATISKNLKYAKEKYGEDIPIDQHPIIRSEEACYLSSSKAINLEYRLKSFIPLVIGSFFASI